MLSTRILAWLLLFAGFTLHSQLIELPNLELITEKEGLPFNSITDIVQDSKGFLWVSGPNGLARYDGYTFVQVPGQGKDKSATGSLIISLTLDTQGMIWAGCLNGRVSRIDPETLAITHYQLFEKSTISYSNQVFGDSGGTLWCFAESVGLFKFNGKDKFDFIGALDNLPQAGLAQPSFYNRVASFYEESPAVLWLASSNGLYRFQTDTKKIEHVSVMSDDPNRPAFLNRIVPDGKKGFWCSTWGTGLIHINTQTGEFKKYLFEPGFAGTSNIIHGLARKSDHELWISSRGLGVFDEITKTFSFYNDRQDYNTDLTSIDILEAQSGIIWIVTDKGLMKWAPNQNRFTYFRLKVTRSDNFSYYGISQVLDDPATGRKIIATQYADGLHIFNPNGKELVLPVYLHRKAEPYMLINDLMMDRDGKIIVVSRDQLYELTRDNRLVKINGPSALLSLEVIPYYYKIIQSSNGDYWLGSSRNGLFHFSKKNNVWKQITTKTPGTLANNRILGILEDNNQNIWMAHALHGISIYDPTHETWSYISHLEKDSTSLVSNIFTDWTKTKSGKIVFATLEGISIIDTQTKHIKNYSESTGLSNQAIYSVVADSADNIWAMNHRGMVVLNEKGEEIREFSSKDGLKGVYSTFNLQKSGENILACTYQGFYTFNATATLQRLDASAPVFITRLKNKGINVESFNAPTLTHLNYDNNAISIEFAALNFLGDGKNQYRYIMEGLDKSWIETLSNQVNYSGIPSGHYTFRVQLAGSSKQEASVKIWVSTPFWNQWWFRSLLVGLGLAGVYLVYRLRLNQVRQEEKLKTEFNQRLAEVEMKALKAQMSPHFIFNSLNSINRYIIKSEPEKASLYLTKFSKLIRLILDSSDHKIISLEQEINALKLYIELEALRFNEKFTYALTVNPELSPMSIGVPPMIIQPFIENAIWHGLLHKETQGHLDISIDRFGSGLQCVITDNGVGRKKAAEMKSKSVNKEKSYGMKITGERLNMLNGESKVSGVEIVDLVDEAGNALGTKVIVKIMSAELEPEF
jgi:ligand-binding sensor domain-containing protein